MTASAADTEKRERQRDQLRRWRAANRERFNASSRERAKRNPDKVKAAYNKWLDANRESERARGLAYRAENLEVCRARDRARYAANPERHHEKNRAYYANNVERRKRSRKEWAAKNPEMARALVRKRRARKMGVGGSHTIEDIRAIQKAQRDRCAGCECNLNGKFEIDHIKPLSKGGSDNRRNLQLLCGPCNRSKKDSDPAVFYRRKGKLI